MPQLPVLEDTKPKVGVAGITVGSRIFRSYFCKTAIAEPGADG